VAERWKVKGGRVVEERGSGESCWIAVSRGGNRGGTDAHEKRCGRNDTARQRQGQGKEKTSIGKAAYEQGEAIESPEHRHFLCSRKGERQSKRQSS
jgi:hypothetical protein